MSDSQINIPDLKNLSLQLADKFFKSNDIYSLLVLSLVTVTTYSRKKIHIIPRTRIEIAIAFLPDLIEHLAANNKLSDSDANKLKKKIEKRNTELTSILESYIYVSGGLHTKIDLIDEDKKRCIIV